MHLGRVAAHEESAVSTGDAEALVQRTTQHADGLRRRSPHVPDAEPAVVARGDEARVGEPRDARHALVAVAAQRLLRRAAARVP